MTIATMRKLLPVASVLLLGLAEAATTIKIKFTFDMDASSDLIANFAYGDLDTLTDGAIGNECDGSSSGSISAAEDLPDGSGQYVILECPGVDDTFAAQIKLAALVPEVAAEVVTIFNDVVAGDGSLSIPALQKVQLVLDSAAASDRFPETKEVALSMTACSSAITLAQIMEGLAETLRLTQQSGSSYVNIELKDDGGGIPTCTGRRMLAQADLTYSLPGLSRYQLDLVNGALGDGEFSTKLVSEMSAAGADVTGISGVSAQMTNGGGGSLTDVTTIEKYEAESSVTNMHNFARLQGGNDFLGSVTAGGDKQMNYLMGAGLIATPCILCLVYTLLGYCCHIGCCKCCLNNKKPYSKKFPPVLIASAVFLFFFFVGWALFMKSASSFTDMKEFFVGSGNSFLGIIDTIGNSFDTINSASDELAAELALSKYTNCDLLKSMDAGLEIDNPLGSIGDSLSTAKTGIDGYESYNVILIMMLVVLPGLYFAMGLAESISTFLLLKNSSKLKCCHCCAKCGCCCSPCALISMWFGAMFCVLLAAVFGDFCAEDPLVSFIETVGLEAELGYLLTCKGAAPDELVDAYVLVSTVAGTLDNLAGLKGMVASSCDDYDGNGGTDAFNEADVDGILALVNKQGDAVFDMIDSLTCFKMNELVNGFLGNGICHGLQPGVYFAWLGCFFCSVSWMLVTFFWVRVSNTYKKLNKVDPTKSNAGTSETEIPPMKESYNPAPQQDAAPQQESVRPSAVNPAAEKPAKTINDDNKLPPIPNSSY